MAEREKPRIRIIFKFSAFYEAYLLNRYQSVGLADNIEGYPIRMRDPIYREIYGHDELHNAHNILNKNKGTCHSKPK